jgi:exonuclease V gamma subunit
MTHVLPWWLAWLAVVASGRDVALRLAGTGDEAASQLTGRIDTEEARRYLTAAIDHYRSGHARALLFEPYLAEHYLDQREKKSRATGELKTPDEALDSTNGWLSNTWQPPHPRRDPWLQPLFGPSPTPLGADANASSFVRVVESVGRPLREHLAEPQEDEPGADS